MWQSRTLQVALAPAIMPEEIRNMITESVEEDEAGKCEKDSDCFVLYSEKEEKALKLFLEEIAKFPTEFKTETAEYFLIRWLRARNLNIMKATEMLRKYYEWKSSNLLLPENWEDRNWQPPEIIMNEFKYKFLGFDKLGSPVIWMPLGRCRPKIVIDAGLKDECFKHLYKRFDELLGYCEQARINTNGKCTKLVGLFDAACFSYWQFSNLEVIQCGLKLVKEYEAYFPEILEACYVINVPYFFSFFFNMVAPLLAGTTLSRIHIFDHNQSKWKPVLRDAIPLDILPVEYGGEAEAVLACYKT